MAKRKRLMDTEIFKDRFVSTLPKDYKLLWIYILLDCDHAGIWQANFPFAKVAAGIEVEESEAVKLLGDKIKVLTTGDWFIPGFLKFQYGMPLNLKIPAVESAYKIIVNKGLSDNIQTVGQLLRVPPETVKDKNKSKNEDKDKDKNKKKTYENPEEGLLDLSVESCYQLYPNKRDNGATTAKSLKDKITIRKILKEGGYDLAASIQQYVKTANGYPMNLKTFLNNLPDQSAVHKSEPEKSRVTCRHEYPCFEVIEDCIHCGVSHIHSYTHPTEYGQLCECGHITPKGEK